jgi:hypothetical protein
MFFLGCYLLVKDRHTYVTYFADNPFTWFAEYGVDLGAPTASAQDADIGTLLSGAVYRRDFEHGFVLVNPTDTVAVAVLDGTYSQVVPSGDGSIDESGAPDGELGFTDTSTVTLQPWNAAVLLE